MKSGIYKILNKINGKFYIGSTVYINNRKAKHWELLKKGTHHNKHLQAAYNKYGKEIFEFQIIEYCEKEKLIEREQYWIDFTEAIKYGYNMLPNARNRLGFKISEETKNKMSKASLGKLKTEEHKANLRGRAMSLKQRKDISNRRKGTTLSLETRAKISESWHKNKNITFEHQVFLKNT